MSEENHETQEYLVPFSDDRVKSFSRVRSRRFVHRLTRWMVAIFVLLAAAVALAPWQQTAFGDGQVIALSPSERQQRVDAPVEGWLEEWFVQEGSRVQQGDPIVRIVDNDPELMKRLGLEKEAVGSRLNVSEVALETAQRNVRRQWALYQQGLSSRKQYEEAQLKEAEQLKELNSDRAELLKVQVRVARQGLRLVRAPSSGVILRRAAGQGSVSVKAGQSLAILVPETKSRVVELWMDGNDLPLVSKGREVRLQFEGWPALQFSGWPSVAVGTFGGEISLIDAAGAGRPGKFRILVVPHPGEKWPEGPLLRQGVRAHGWVILNRVKLGYELWRRFNDFPPSLPEAPAKESLMMGGAHEGSGPKGDSAKSDDSEGK